MSWLADPQIWIALVTLTVLEIVLGIDNIIFISILTGKLAPEQRKAGRLVGLLLAMLTRIVLLFSLTWIMGLTSPLFALAGIEFSGRDLILLAGGLFLLAKSTFEIHERLEGAGDGGADVRARASFASIVTQVAILDIVFSLDSVITAIGMTGDLWVMVTAVILAVAVMMLSAGFISDFVHAHPTIKMLALSFLLLIGVTLIAEGFGRHIPKGYIYFAMAFSVFVEMLNLRIRTRHSPPLELRGPVLPEKE
jgi:predicted tellurium resistance membrane protein TerC